MAELKGYLINESEHVFAKPKVLSDNVDVTIIDTILQDAGRKNRNKRIYTMDALKYALYSNMIQEKLKRKTFYGEAGHPLSDTIERQSYMDQTRISHIVTDIRIEGNIIKGTVESANTRVGKDFQGLIRQGSEVGFSMRGLGGVVRDKGTYKEIDKPLVILAYDWVVYPSHQDAYMTKLIKENADVYGNTRPLNEGACIPCEIQEVLNYVKNESTALNEMTEDLGFDLKKNKITLEDNNRIVSVNKGNNEILKVFLEDYIQCELNNFFKNL